MKHRFAVSVVLAGILWGIIGLFVRDLDESGLDSLQIVFVRVLFSMILLALGLLFFKRAYFKIRLRDLWCFFGTGVLSITFFNFCYFYTMTATSLSVASVLLYTAPVFVAVMASFLFGEKMTILHVCCLALALLGCGLVTGVWLESPELSMTGILTGLGAGFGYALYSIFGRYALERGYHTLTVNFWTFLMASAVLLPFVRPWEITEQIAKGDFPWVGTACLVLLSTVLPYLLYTYGLTGIESGKASIMATVEPVVATVVGVLVYREGLTVWSACGMILVLLAVVLLNLPVDQIRKKSDADNHS